MVESPLNKKQTILGCYLPAKPLTLELIAILHGILYLPVGPVLYLKSSGHAAKFSLIFSTVEKLNIIAPSYGIGSDIYKLTRNTLSISPSAYDNDFILQLTKLGIGKSIIIKSYSTGTVVVLINACTLNGNLPGILLTFTYDIDIGVSHPPNGNAFDVLNFII